MKYIILIYIMTALNITKAQNPVSFATKNDLKKQAGTNGVSRYLVGMDNMRDGKGANYAWDSSSTSIDDGYNVISVMGVSTGRWIRVNPTMTRDSVNYWMNLITSNIPTNNNQLTNGAAYITSSALTWGNITGKPTIPTNTNQLTNGSGFITGINSSMVTTALGYTPLQTESDPSVSATVKAITATNVNNWNAAATASGKTRVYDKTGLISSNGMPMTDTFTISTATPTISFATLMSNIGATAFKIRSVTGYRVGAVTGTSPQVAVTSLTSNSASFIVNQTNTATVTILSINVLSGLPTILAPDPQNVKLVLDVVFY